MKIADKKLHRPSEVAGQSQRKFPDRLNVLAPAVYMKVEQVKA
jgi:hypothetical protein